MICLHVPAAVWWLCSDQDPRWREWRLRAGLREFPPNESVMAQRRRELRARLAALDEAELEKMRALV